MTVLICRDQRSATTKTTKYQQIIVNTNDYEDQGSATNVEARIHNFKHKESSNIFQDQGSRTNVEAMIHNFKDKRSSNTFQDKGSTTNVEARIHNFFFINF